MAWSPFAGGDIFSGTDEKAKRVQIVLKTVAEKMDCAVDQVVVAWLLRHPSDICPVMGSGKIARLAAAVDAMTITLSDDDWFRIWVASQGRSVA
jgi:predicted oxidoreductase